MTIEEVQSSIPLLLEALRVIQLPPELMEIRAFLLPEGFVPVIQLEEGGRKKRSSAAAWNWKPDTGDIHIYYEPAPTAVTAVSQPSHPTPAVAMQPPAEPDASIRRRLRTPNFLTGSPQRSA